MEVAGEKLRRVLSIQSHVVSGYVGNKAAVFPLQLLGFEVDYVNSVQFSNHTGYPVLAGKDQILDSENLKLLMDGIHANNLSRYSHVLTGYVSSESFLKQISTEVKRLKQVNPDLRYHCDPVLGDHGEFYVPENLVQIYRSHVLPIADVITPNDFEVRMLTGFPCDTLDNTLEALNKLHDIGPSTVVLSSIHLLENPPDILTLICSCRNAKGAYWRSRLDFPKLEAVFTGTGDLFSALFLAWSSICGLNSCDEACERAVSSIHKVLTFTLQHNSSDHPVNNGSMGKAVPPELKLIPSKEFIEKGDILFRAKLIDCN